MAEKKYGAAMSAYETAFGVGKSGPVIIKLHAAAELAGKRGAWDAKLAQWLKESPDDVAVRIYAADVALNGGKYRAAAEHYERVLQTQPENVMVLNNLAWAYQQLKDRRAMATAVRAYELSPDNSAVADTYGWMLVEKGEVPRGIELLQKAIASAPNAHETRFHLAQALVKAGDKANARAELEKLESSGAKFPQLAEAMSLLKQLR